MSAVINIEATTLVTMTRTCARDLTDRINSTSEDLAGMIQRAHDERAWEALGYSTWNEYVDIELRMSKQQSFRLLDFAKISQQIAESPIGDPLPAPSSESIVRPLKKVAPGKRVEVYAAAVEKAGGAPTAAQVHEVVQELVPGTVKAASPITVTIDAADRIWTVAKAHLDKITKDDESRERVLLEVISYCSDKLTTTGKGTNSMVLAKQAAALLAGIPLDDTHFQDSIKFVEEYCKHRKRNAREGGTSK